MAPELMLFERNKITIYDTKITVSGKLYTLFSSAIAEILLFDNKNNNNDFVTVKLVDGRKFISDDNFKYMNTICSIARIKYDKMLYSWCRWPEPINEFYTHCHKTNRYKCIKLQKILSQEDIDKGPLILLIRYFHEAGKEYMPELVDYGKVIYQKKIEPHLGLLVNIVNYWDITFVTKIGLSFVYED